MTRTDMIFELLEDISPEGYCDDCISEQADIKPRQQVNQICRRLAAQDKLQRYKSVCHRCNSRKIVNTLKSRNMPSVKFMRESVASYSATTYHANQGAIDVEHLRTQVVHICRQLWAKQRKEEPPRSISVLINILRDAKILPPHQANMMLTICGLRNVHVYECIEMGQRENNIAVEAWGIISEWWNSLVK